MIKTYTKNMTLLVCGLLSMSLVACKSDNKSSGADRSKPSPTTDPTVIQENVYTDSGVMMETVYTMLDSTPLEVKLTELTLLPELTDSTKKYTFSVLTNSENIQTDILDNKVGQFKFAALHNFHGLTQVTVKVVDEEKKTFSQLNIKLRVEEAACRLKAHRTIVSEDEFNQKINAKNNGNFTLCNDITITKPLSTTSLDFKGRLNGIHHKIIFSDNAFAAGQFTQGLFNTLQGARVHNLTLSGVKVSADTVVGALASGVINSTVKNVHVESSAITLNAGDFEVPEGVAKEVFAGGIAGSCIGSDIIDSSVKSTVIKVDPDKFSSDVHMVIGGICGLSVGMYADSGEVTRETKIIRSQVYSDVANTEGVLSLMKSRHDTVGGIVGEASYTTVAQSISSAKLWAACQVGGVIGSVQEESRIRNTFVNADIELDASVCSLPTDEKRLVGGFIGQVVNTNIKTNDFNIYNSLSVSSIAAIASPAPFVDNCMVAQTPPSINVKYSFYDEGKCENHHSSSLEMESARKSEQIFHPEVFIGWDFANIWIAPTAESIPALKWSVE